MAKSVCIIGAGPAGIVAAKTLIHNAPKGEFRVRMFEADDRVGGLWPSSKDQDGGKVHPFMLGNQSKHTMQFSDLAWEEDTPQTPPAWMVGRYLTRYFDRYLAGQPYFALHLRSRVERVKRLGASGWEVTVARDEKTETVDFDYVLVASGFFGQPIWPEGLQRVQGVPICHSSEYRRLEDLLRKSPPGGGKILIVGGQMSGIEIAGTVASHLSSAQNSPGESKIPDIDKYSIHNLIQRPIWVFPLYTSPVPMRTAAPFLPLDFSSYNCNNRPLPLSNRSGHISEDAAKAFHGIFEGVLGGDQSAFSPILRIDDDTKTKPAYLAVSDWYCEFVRSGLITVSNGKLESLEGNTATVSPDGSRIDNIAAVIVATGFDASPCLDFLPREILETIHHSPKHTEQPIALAFHGTYHPEVPGLGFVGFYRSPYWGNMQMQARVLARLWSESEQSEAISKALHDKLKSDDSIQRTLELRNDPRLAQFPMGDYPWLMQEQTQALSLEKYSAPQNGNNPNLSHNNLPLDMLTPARYPALNDDAEAKAEAQRSAADTLKVTRDGLTTPRFIPRAVFRSLLGTWKLERDLTSRLPSHPSGHFSGTARFLLREKTPDGLPDAAADAFGSAESSSGLEYLYIEDGDFKTNQGLEFRATRRYIWRYDERSEVLSVWFAKPDDPMRADYLFHEIEFEIPETEGRKEGWPAKAGHLCEADYYDVKYNFAFQAVNLREWNIEYAVKGPKKDYTIHGTYTR